MARRSAFRFWISLVATLCVAVLTIHLAGAPQAARQGPQKRRFLVVAKTEADVDALRADVATAGGTVVHDLGQIGALAVSGTDAIRERLRASAFAAGVAADHVVRLIEPARAREMSNGPTGRHSPPTAFFRRPAPTPDPAFSLTGLMWSIQRTNAPHAWKTTLGSAAVKVGVADTGLDFTHSELAPRILTSWISRRLKIRRSARRSSGFQTLTSRRCSAARKRPTGTATARGSAATSPLRSTARASTASRRRSDWSRSRSRSGAARRTIPTIIAAFLYAADHGIDVVNISFGGYLDRTDPDQDLPTRSISRRCDTPAGTERRSSPRPATNTSSVGPGGLVLSHGSLTIPGDPPSSTTSGSTRFRAALPASSTWPRPTTS